MGNEDLCRILVGEYGVQRVLALEIIRRLTEAGDGELTTESLRNALAYGGKDALVALAVSSLGQQGVEDFLEGVEVVKEFHSPPKADEPIN